MMTKEEYYAQIKEMYAQKYESKDKKIEAADRRFREYLMSRNDDDDETDWWYRSEKENPEDQAINDEELVVNEVEKVKKDLVASDVDGETEISIDQNQLVQEAKNHSTDSVHETSLLHHNNSLLKHQVSISHLEFSHRSPIECLDVYEELPSASIARQVFDPLPLKKKLLRNRRRTTFSKTWCFKFKELDVRQEDVLIVLLAFLHMNTIETRYATGKCDEMFEVARDVSKRSMLGLTFGIRESNAGQEQQAVCEQIIMVTVWLYQISLVLQQVMKNKKIRLSKRWWFKYRFDEEDQGSVQSRAGYSLSRSEMLTFISQAKALLFESKDWREKQTPTLQINISQYRCTQEAFVVIRFLLRRHLHLNLDCEEPELAGRKRNHGLFIRLLNKLKQQRCPKSWMFKFKTDSKPARTNHILHQEKKPNEFEQVVKHTPFSVVKLGKPKGHDALLLFMSGDESFQIKHKWRFKLLPLILEWELYSDCLVLITNSAQQLDISRLMILMSVGWFTNLRSQLLPCKAYRFLLYKP